MALGAEGVWCGSVWLTTEEAETHPAVKQKFLAATSRDTIRSRSLTGKPARMLRSAWTDEWDGPKAPAALAHAAAERRSWPRPRPASAGRPPPRARGHSSWPTTSSGRWSAGSTDPPARQVVLDMVTEYADVAQRFAEQVAEEGS